MVQLPQGTVTLVFTDVEGSTRLLQELGRDRYVRNLEAHRRVLRGVFTGHGGVEVEMQGDAFHFVFAHARDAVAAAAAVQQALALHDWDGDPIRVRIGIHTGEPLVSDGLYAGLDVHRAARVMSAGHGGQVLVSEATRVLVADELPARLEFRDLGEHRLKDLSAPQRLYELVGDGLESRFPPLRTLHQTNLPVPSTPFLGRERELRRVTEVLADEGVRLLTLTGAGGSGKTRLALQAAHAVVNEYRDGVFWANLAPLRDPQLVLATVAAEVGAEQELSEHIGEKRLLLLLDNFEQVVEAANDLAALLASCPNLDVLVTSREALNIAGEHVLDIQPLTQPDAVALFVERASAVRHDFQADSDVDAICQRVDRLPLAIELAAARVKVLSSEAILARLDKRLPLLTGGPRDVPKRQQTLRSTIEWSYELLPPAERQQFARLSAFTGGCTLDAAEQVCEGGLETLASLVSKNLLRHGDDRYWMLETIKEYASDRLEQSGERDDVIQRLVEYLLGLVEGDVRGIRMTPPDAALQELLGKELDNLRAAVTWALASGDTVVAARLAIEAQWFGHGQSGVAAEQLRWLEEVLQHPAAIPAHEQASVLRTAAQLAWVFEDLRKATVFAEQSLALHREPDAAFTAFLILGNVASVSGDYDRARSLYEESLDCVRRGSNTALAYMPLHGLGSLEQRRGNLNSASGLLEQSAQLALVAGDTGNASFTLHSLGDIALTQGDAAQAKRSYSQALRNCRDIKLWRIVPVCVAGLAAAEAAMRNVRRAATLWGAVDALERETGWPLRAKERDLYESRLQGASEQALLAFAAAAEAGRRMTPNEVIEYALGGGDEQSP